MTFEKNYSYSAYMILTYGVVLMSFTSGWKSKCIGEKSSGDSLDLAFWQDSEIKENLVAVEHARFEQIIQGIVEKSNDRVLCF